MPICLYIDEDAMNSKLVKGLRARGFDVKTVLDEGMTGFDDDAQLEYASARKRTLYTFNVGDFCRIHKEYMQQNKFHAGIIVVYRKRYDIGEQIKRLSNLVQEKSPQEMINNLVFL